MYERMRSRLRNARSLSLRPSLYSSQRFLILAKQVIMFLVRVLLLTWIIIAYFMIRSMEFKSQAERNK